MTQSETSRSKAMEKAKEYLTMADVFRDVVQPERFNYALNSGKAKYAAHAINSHDELVAEVERLLAQIKDAFIDGCLAGWDMSGEGYNAEHHSTSDDKIREKFIAKADEYTK